MVNEKTRIEWDAEITNDSGMRLIGVRSVETDPSRVHVSIYGCATEVTIAIADLEAVVSIAKRRSNHELARVKPSSG